jgi:hypothetical protein
MNGLIFLILLFFGCFVVAKKTGLLDRLTESNGKSHDNGWPVYAKRLLSPGEQKCYHRLCAAYPDHIVLAQVALSQLLAVKKGQGNNYQSVLNRFRQLTADFVVCNKDFSVAAVFELDDRSHDSPKRQDSDSRKGAALAAAGVSLHRLNAAKLPDVSALPTLTLAAARPQNV